MKKKTITNKKKDILFWITGLSRSDKTTPSKTLHLKLKFLGEIEDGILNEINLLFI